MLNYSRNKNLINFARKIKFNLSKTPSGARFAATIQRSVFRLLFKNPEELFTYYYDTNKWGNVESLSGPGSSIEATSNVREQIKGIINEFKIKKLLDAPCGDFHWFKMIDIPSDTNYIGGDIVKKMVDLNNQKYSKSNIKFIYLDIINDKIPQVDLWLCRDTLFHFSNSDINIVLSGLKTSQIKYFLSTTYPDSTVNSDIITGDFRPINLEKTPFCLQYNLIKYIDDSDSGHQGKKLGLWEINN
jgi:hypothetical protein